MKESAGRIFLDPQGVAVAHLRRNDATMDALLGSMDVGAVGYEIEPCGFEALIKTPGGKWELTVHEVIEQ